MSHTLTPHKVAIIGAGHVGSHVASAIAIQGIAAEIVLIDPPAPEKARAQALDLADSVSHLGARTRVRSGGYGDIADASIAVVAAGPLPDIEAGQSDRLDTLPATLTVADDIIDRLSASGFAGIIIDISNPADIATGYLAARLGWPSRRILSTGTGLDSARLRRTLGDALDVDPRSVEAYMIGEHGERQFAAWSSARIGGVPLEAYLAQTGRTLDRDKVETEARAGGWTVLTGKGSTEFGIGATAARIAAAILRDEHTVLAVAASLEGEYGQEDVFASVPAVIGARGVEAVLELPLDDAESRAFASCAAHLRDITTTALSR